MKEDNISSTSCNEFIINNKLVTDGHIISNSFNEYFVNVGRLLSEDTDCDTNPLHYVRVRARYYKVLYLFLKNKTSYILLTVLFCLILDVPYQLCLIRPTLVDSSIIVVLVVLLVLVVVTL